MKLLYTNETITCDYQTITKSYSGGSLHIEGHIEAASENARYISL